MISRDDIPRVVSRLSRLEIVLFSRTSRTYREYLAPYTTDIVLTELDYSVPQPSILRYYYSYARGGPSFVMAVIDTCDPYLWVDTCDRPSTYAMIRDSDALSTYIAAVLVHDPTLAPYLYARPEIRRPSAPERAIYLARRQYRLYLDLIAISTTSTADLRIILRDPDHWREFVHTLTRVDCGVLANSLAEVIAPMRIRPDSVREIMCHLHHIRADITLCRIVSAHAQHTVDPRDFSILGIADHPYIYTQYIEYGNFRALDIMGRDGILSPEHYRRLESTPVCITLIEYMVISRYARLNPGRILEMYYYHLQYCVHHARHTHEIARYLHRVCSLSPDIIRSLARLAGPHVVSVLAQYHPSQRAAISAVRYIPHTVTLSDISWAISLRMNRAQLIFQYIRQSGPGITRWVERYLLMLLVGLMFLNLVLSYFCRQKSEYFVCNTMHRIPYEVYERYIPRTVLVSLSLTNHEMYARLSYIYIPIYPRDMTTLVTALGVNPYRGLLSRVSLVAYVLDPIEKRQPDTINRLIRLNTALYYDLIPEIRDHLYVSLYDQMRCEDHDLRLVAHLILYRIALNSPNDQLLHVIQARTDDPIYQTLLTIERDLLYPRTTRAQTLLNAGPPKYLLPY